MPQGPVPEIAGDRFRLVEPGCAAAGSRKPRRPISSPRRGRDGTDAPWPPPSEFVAGGVDLGVALVVFERDRAGGNVEDEGAEGAVVVLPAVIDLRDNPRRAFRPPLQGSCSVRGWSGLSGGQLNFGGRTGTGILSSSGVPGLDVLDLAGIAGAVVIDGDAVNAGFGEGGEDDGPCCGRGCRRRARRTGVSVVSVMAVSLCFVVEWWRARTGEDRAPAGARSPFRKCASGVAAPLSATPTGSSSVRKAGRSADAMSISAGSASSGSIADVVGVVGTRRIVGRRRRHRPCRAAATRRHCRAPPGRDRCRRRSSPDRRRFRARRRAPASCRRRDRAPSGRRGFPCRSRGRAPSSRGPSNWRRSAARNRRTGSQGAGRRLRSPDRPGPRSRAAA